MLAGEVDFCVAKSRRGLKNRFQFSTPIKLYIVFTLSLMPRRARPFLCRRKERAERFAFKGGFRFPLWIVGIRASTQSLSSVASPIERQVWQKLKIAIRQFQPPYTTRVSPLTHCNCGTEIVSSKGEPKTGFFDILKWVYHTDLW